MRPVDSNPTPTIWTHRRKSLGNLLPFLVWLPIASAGLVVMTVTAELLGIGLLLLVLATLAGWITLNITGLFENRRMKLSLQRLLVARGDGDVDNCPFVGFCSPRYRGVLDAHEDVGYLRFLSDRLEFISETRIVEFQKDQIDRVKLRPNVHSLVGLGRWVSVEGTLQGKPLRMLLEPRDHDSMLANLRASANLRKRIILWAASDLTGNSKAT